MSHSLHMIELVSEHVKTDEKDIWVDAVSSIVSVLLYQGIIYRCIGNRFCRTSILEHPNCSIESKWKVVGVVMSYL